MWALLNPFAFGRWIAWLGKALASGAVLDWTMDKMGAFMGYASSVGYWLFPGLWEKAYKDFQKEVATAAEIASGPAATIVRSMSGMPISADMLAKIASGGLSEGEREQLGASFVGILEDIFRPGPIAAGFRARNAGDAEMDTFARFVGRNAQLQLAGVIVDLLKDRLPDGLTLGLGEMAEKVEKILGFEDSQEEIMEPLMEKIIITGLERRYNRIIQPTDYTPSDALGLFIRGKIDRGLLDKVLNNEGIMDDTRENLIQLNAKNLTAADEQDLYDWGQATLGQVVQHFRDQGYLQEDADVKAGLVAANRLRKLEGELENVMQAQAIKGVIPEAEYESFLRNNAYKPDEVSTLLNIVRRKKTLGTATAAKRITGSFSITPERVKVGDIALIKWNIRNADSVSITGLGEVDEQGEEPITVTQAGRYTLTASNELHTIHRTQQVLIKGEELRRRPTVSLTASPGRIKLGTPVELKWHTSNAESVVIDQVGVVAESGAVPVFPLVSTIYTLRATNAQGTTIAQDIVFVELPDIDFGREQRPTISFSITPTVVRAAQPQAELNWSINRAEGGTLTFPDGTSQDVSRNGAMLVTASASGIYTLRASNTFGETQNQEGLIFQGAEEEEP